MTAQERIQNHYDELTQKYKNLMAVANSLPEALLTIAEPDTVFFEDLKINIPYDIHSLRKTRKLLKGWKFIKVWGNATRTHTYRNFRYRHPDFELPIVISMDLSEKGSTCRIEKVGEKIEEIYKVVCD